ncbi:hypothetical protein [Natronomonas sp. EA1]|uniref:hypothetical protein n=1 Tax=Natronomonas sp. EA1 TaxID=3421655 RepID=UPI003EBF87FA
MCPRLSRLRDAKDHAQAVLDGEASPATLSAVQETIEAAAPELDDSLPGVDEYDDDSYPQAVVYRVEEYLHPTASLDTVPEWVRLARLCERYAREI